MAAMGLGPLGNPRAIMKRKFRWTMALSTPCGVVPPWFCKTGGRPHLEIDEVEINFLNAVSWIPGKGKWQPLTFTYYDVASADFSGLFSWFATLYDFTDPVNLRMGEKIDYAGTALLTMYDGCGKPIEFWLLENVFPTSVNFGDLDMAASEFCEIEITLRYSQVRYQSVCGNINIKPCCTGC